MTTTIEPFVHTFPATPVRPAYEGLAVRHGLAVYPVVSYHGRLCYVTGSQRLRRRKGWNYFNSLSVHYLDGTSEQIPCGKFNKDARSAPVPS